MDSLREGGGFRPGVVGTVWMSPELLPQSQSQTAAPVTLPWEHRFPLSASTKSVEYLHQLGTSEDFHQIQFLKGTFPWIPRLTIQLALQGHTWRRWAVITERGTVRQQRSSECIGLVSGCPVAEFQVRLMVPWPTGLLPCGSHFEFLF